MDWSGEIWSIGIKLSTPHQTTTLAHKDSNLDFQGQNLTCYHYTMGEFAHLN